MIRTITPQTLAAWLKTEKICVIDVREPDEYHTEHMTESQLIPLGQITVNKLPTQSGPIVIHCQRGKRSAQACEKLLTENPNLELYSLEGGINAWHDAGLYTKCGTAPGTTGISLDRQVQITTGSLILLGIGLGFLLHPGFFGLAGIIGAGLLFSGLSGSCYLKQGLSHLPWNKKSGLTCP